MWNMLKVFERMFGPEFWSNAILEATHWSYSKSKTRIRNESGMNESLWARQFNDRLRNDFEFSFDLPSVFIDTFYYRKSEIEVDKFNENTEELWSFAQSKLDSPFHCRDIQVAMTDISHLTQKVKNLTEENDRKTREIESLNQTVIVYNNLVSEHHSQVGTTESPDREFVSSNPSTSFSLAELVGWGTGAFLLGVLVTTMATMWILNLSHYRRISTEDEQFESESELDGTAVKDRNC